MNNVLLEIDCIDHKIKQATHCFSFIKEESFLYVREYHAIEFAYKVHLKKLNSRKEQLKNFL